MDKHEERIKRAQYALEGLSVGDAFGEQFLVPEDLRRRRLQSRQVSDSPVWPWTDDTAMAIAIVEVLQANKALNPKHLAEQFSTNYEQEPGRGYGGGAHRLLNMLSRGVEWRKAAESLFQGTGSYGNGAAMRVAPLGAYFADDLEQCAEAVRASALPTHAHPEGIAGAVAMAVATGVAYRTRSESVEVMRDQLFETVLEATPEGLTREGIALARQIPFEAPIAKASARLGNGSQISAQDTVPFCIWMVARQPRHFEEALWETVSAGGDCDTTCAMVGGALRLAAPEETFPKTWRERREPLPAELQDRLSD